MLSQIVRANMHGVLTQNVHFVPKLVPFCAAYFVTHRWLQSIGPKTFVSIYQTLPNSIMTYLLIFTAVTRHLIAVALTLPLAAVGATWSLLGSPRNGQAALYLFQKTFTVLGVHL